MRATQLTDFGADQSPMMTGHSSKIRTRWSNATTAKITPEQTAAQDRIRSSGAFTR